MKTNVYLITFAAFGIGEFSKKFRAETGASALTRGKEWVERHAAGRTKWRFVRMSQLDERGNVIARLDVCPGAFDLPPHVTVSGEVSAVSRLIQTEFWNIE